MAYTYKDVLNRQKDLKLREIESVAIIGVGGVGSWVAGFLALSGVTKIAIIDNDVVEATNLNRTFFTLQDAQDARPKVQAVAEWIMARRECDITPVKSDYEKLPLSFFDDYGLIVDCRDTSKPLPVELAAKMLITGGYNGMQMSMHINPTDSIMGQSPTGYTITPSWIIPPVVIASLICTYILSSRRRKKEWVKTVNLNNLIARFLDCPDLYEGIKQSPVTADKGVGV